MFIQILRTHRSRIATMIAGFVLILFGVSGTRAETSCRAVFDPRWPGLEECTVSAEIESVEASPPKPQQRPLWCWAASLSMIYTALGHPISQESIVIQNFGALLNASSGPWSITVARMNRTYKDDDGQTFTSRTRQIFTMDQAVVALDNDIPLLYSTTSHATVQTELKYQQAPRGPKVIKGGKLWDPWPTKGWRDLAANDVMNFAAAWAIQVD